TQLMTTARRRPSASDIQEQNSRPKMETAPTQMTKYDAWPGVVFSTSTNSVVNHKVSPTEPVWLMPVRQDTARLRGYLNSSRHTVFSTLATVAGNWIEAGSTCNAQARDRRASSMRPLPISQCGDSGTQARINSVRAAGSRPTTNRPRQPTEGSRKAPAMAPRSVPAGSRLVVRPVIQPRL